MVMIPATATNAPIRPSDPHNSASFRCLKSQMHDSTPVLLHVCTFLIHAKTEPDGQENTQPESTPKTEPERHPFPSSLPFPFRFTYARVVQSGVPPPSLSLAESGGADACCISRTRSPTTDGAGEGGPRCPHGLLHRWPIRGRRREPS